MVTPRKMFKPKLIGSILATPYGLVHIKYINKKEAYNTDRRLSDRWEGSVYQSHVGRITVRCLIIGWQQSVRLGAIFIGIWFHHANLLSAELVHLSTNISSGHIR